MTDAMQSLVLIGLILLFLYPFVIYQVMIAWMLHSNCWKTNAAKSPQVPHVAVLDVAGGPHKHNSRVTPVFIGRASVALLPVVTGKVQTAIGKAFLLASLAIVGARR